MRVISILAGLAFLLGVALDAFQTIVLPRRPRGRIRLTRIFSVVTWTPWSAAARRIENLNLREQVYSVYGPLSLILLLVLWAILLVAGFGLIFFGLGSAMSDPLRAGQGAGQELLSDLYVSGTTIFTVGLGDVLPKDLFARALMVMEGGVGLGFVAVVIGYFPVLYAAFSRREVSIALLDARAGSPPTAAELLRRHSFDGGQQELVALLAEWERWAADILESHISYPVLCFYRSQHDNQSWLSALTAILDACALLIASTEQVPTRQAQLTFAMARHALVDLGHVFHLEADAERERNAETSRLPAEDFQRLCGELAGTEINLCADLESTRRLVKIRALYEPQAIALAKYLGMGLPAWIPEPAKPDPWQRVAALRGHPEGESDETSKSLAEAVGQEESNRPRQMHVSDRATAYHLEDDEPHR